MDVSFPRTSLAFLADFSFLYFLILLQLIGLSVIETLAGGGGGVGWGAEGEVVSASPII